MLGLLPYRKSRFSLALVPTEERVPTEQRLPAEEQVLTNKRLSNPLHDWVRGPDLLRTPWKVNPAILGTLLISLFLNCLMSFGCARHAINNSTNTNDVAPLAARPDRYLLKREQLKIHSNFYLPETHRLVEDLVDLRLRLCDTLSLPKSDEAIDVYLFQNPQLFDNHSRQQKLPISDRRAYFIQTDTTLSVYASWSDFVGEDLRHELTHGYLHSVAPTLPLWLDEGIAEYFEIPEGQGGFHPTHLQLLIQNQKANPQEFSLSRLEQLSDPASMTQIDYAQSWLWVHFLLSTDTRYADTLKQHLAQWQNDQQATRLSAQLDLIDPELNSKLLAHLDHLTQQFANDQTPN